LIKADMNRREIQANVARKKFEIRTAIFFGWREIQFDIDKKNEIIKTTIFFLPLSTKVHTIIGMCKRMRDEVA
jgi:hypothetical protein